MTASPQRGERFTKYLFSLRIPHMQSILVPNSQNAPLCTIFKFLMPVSFEASRVDDREDIRFSTAFCTDLVHSSCSLQRLGLQADIHRHSCSSPLPNAGCRQLPSLYRRACHPEECSTHHAENLLSHLVDHLPWLDQESPVMLRSGTVGDQAANRIA